LFRETGAEAYGVFNRKEERVFRVLKPATQHPARRNALMIFSHLIWREVLDTLVRYRNGNARP
jgi:hypothetical protein